MLRGSKGVRGRVVAEYVIDYDDEEQDVRGRYEANENLIINCWFTVVRASLFYLRQVQIYRIPVVYREDRQVDLSSS